jgi:adenine deaminase
MQKIQIARELGFPVDGHAPGLQGEEADRYGSVGISTDHECFTLAEAQDKLQAGIKILIREGSAAKNFAALHPLIESHFDRCMFCSDDKHPHDLVTGHINDLVRRSLALGYDLMKVLQVACVNPVKHYNLDVGLLHPHDPADFIVVNNLEDLSVQRTYCHGILVAKSGQSLLPSVNIEPLNYFVTSPKQVADFNLPASGSTVRVIEAVDGQLTTAELHLPARIKNGAIAKLEPAETLDRIELVPRPLEGIACDLDRDILKIAVVNRYRDTKPAVALVKNFGLKRGAIASSVAHDSHNIIVVGTTDAEICAAVNQIILNHGGIAVAEGDSVEILPLPVAGLMSTEDGYQVARKYANLDACAKQLGSTLTAPFMTLSFMALLVIPELKLSDRGLFSSQEFGLVSVCVD